MSEPLNAVFDCNVFLQAITNPNGAAGRCMDLALTGKVLLHVSPWVMTEFDDVTSRPRLLAKMRIREERLVLFKEKLSQVVAVIHDVPAVWSSARDPDDAHYINLAIAVGGRLVVSNDRDLLDLMLQQSVESKQLFNDFPDFRIFTPPQFLATVTAADTI